MALSFHNADHGFRCPNRKLLRNWVYLMVEKHKKEVGALSVIFCSDSYLLKMNQEHLQHDYYTDIITFDYGSGDVLSGDLFISVDRVRDNAKQHKQLFYNELTRVIAHGHLHLIGFKDKDKNEQLEMRAQEAIWISEFQKHKP